MAKKADKKNTTSKNTTSKKATNSKNTKVETKKKATTTKPVDKKETVKKVEEVKKEVVVTNKNVQRDKEQNITIILLVIACLLLTAILIIIIKGNEVELSKGNEVIAEIDGKKFVAEDLFDNLKETYGSSSLIAMIDEFIVDKEITDNTNAKNTAESELSSLKQQYEAYGYTFDEVLAQYGYDSESDLLNEMIISAKRDELAEKYIKEDITEDEINDYYEKEIYGDYNAKHILIAPETTEEMTDEEITEAEDKALKTAKEVISKLEDGAKWNDLVKEYSDDEGSVDSEGLIENFTKGDVVDEFFNAVLDLKDDEHTKEPVKSEYGYHVILKVSSTDKPALEDVKDEILDALVKEKVTEDANIYETTWVKIREKYNLSIKDTTIKKQYKNSTQN